MPTWKACPAVLDVLGTGYTYKTPCDIAFTKDAAGNIQAPVLDAQYRNFLQEREPMPEFVHPGGYHLRFAWWADWAVELPEGYSALYTHPLNRFELPFLTTSGIVETKDTSGHHAVLLAPGHARNSSAPARRTPKSSRSSESTGSRRSTSR